MGHARSVRKNIALHACPLRGGCAGVVGIGCPPVPLFHQQVGDDSLFFHELLFMRVLENAREKCLPILLVALVYIFTRFFSAFTSIVPNFSG